MKEVFKLNWENNYHQRVGSNNGVPQGSILSVTLFALKINSIVLTVPNNPRFSSSLYVDDFQVSFRHSDLKEAQRQMQQFLRQLEDWAKYNGFKFSTTKTKALLFTTVQNLHFKPPMYINNSIIPYADSIKCFGLTWDPRLQWKQPLFRIKTECSRSLGILRAITNQQ